MASVCVIGVSAIQGAFREHIEMLKQLADQYQCPIRVVEVRDEEGLRQCDGLIIPGGESTSMRIVAQSSQDFVQALRTFAISGRPVFGTCAGAILLSDQTVQTLKGGRMDEAQTTDDLTTAEPGILRAIDVVTCRNFFGRQFQSFETHTLQTSLVPNFPAVFIRAPALLRLGPAVQEIAAIEYKDERIVVAAKSNNILVTCFHPELTSDLRLHKIFVDLVLDHKHRVEVSLA